MIEDPDFGYLIHEDPSRFSDWRAYTLLGEVNDGNSWYAHDGVAGHAGLFSTAADLRVLVTLLMDGGLYNGVQLVELETISEFLTPDYTENGLGWAMSSDVLPVSNMPKGAFGHTGFTGTYVYANPAKHLSVILLTNRQNAGVNEDGNYPSLSALRRSVVAAAERSTETVE
jgi:CubicO group peptidase (beta-lactamase class C family)